MRILVVEDEHRLARNIQRYLQQQEFYNVDVAFAGDEGMQKAIDVDYDCILLDVKLPGLNGFEVCAALRERGSAVPILMLTSLTDKKNIVQGLDVGADDYLAKPFALEELSARIRALLRRMPSERESVFAVGDVTLDPSTHQVQKSGETVALAPKEYALFEFLLRRRGTAQNRQSIIEHVWGEREEALFSQTLDVHVAYVRKKLGKDVIVTVPGTGYLVPAA